jgi:predicted secreted hydrolase
MSAPVLVPGCCPAALYEATSDAPAVRLPLDESPHCYGSEWWYYTGRLVTEDERMYGVQAVIFHVADVPLLFFAEGWIAHFAILDASSGEFLYDQGRWLEPDLQPESPSDGFDLGTPLIHMTGAQGTDQLQAATADGQYAVDLTLFDERGAVIHGSDGYVPFGTGDWSFYYSRPVMQATGTMLIDGELHDVTGTFWFDRQWGRDLTNPWLRWDWFSIRLEDGTRIMLFTFPDDMIASGTYIPPTGDFIPISADEFTTLTIDWWTSPHTGITYPSGWEIEIPTYNLLMEVMPVVNDQEIDARSTTLNVYWEGLCTIEASRGDETLTGDAYVELANY